MHPIDLVDYNDVMNSSMWYVCKDPFVMSIRRRFILNHATFSGSMLLFHV